jgi:serine/threonine-protein kinase
MSTSYDVAWVGARQNLFSGVNAMMFSSLEQLPTVAANQTPPAGSSVPVGGETVEARLARGPIPLPEALRIAERVLRALNAPHALGIAHGNISVRTVFLESAGVVRILDAVGRAEANDPAIDITSVGGLLFAMLCGATSNASMPPPALWGPDLSPEARALVDRALASNETRWPDVPAMLAGIDEARLAMILPSKAPVSPPSPVPPDSPCVPLRLRSVTDTLRLPAMLEAPTLPELEPSIGGAPGAPLAGEPTASGAGAGAPIATAPRAPIAPAPMPRASLYTAEPLVSYAPEAPDPGPLGGLLLLLRRQRSAALIALAMLAAGALIALGIMLGGRSEPRATPAAGTAPPAASAAAEERTAKAGVTASATTPRTRAHMPLRAASFPASEVVRETDDAPPAPSSHTPPARPLLAALSASARPLPFVTPPPSSASARPALAAPPPAPAAASATSPIPTGRRQRGAPSGRPSGGAPASRAGDVLDRRD